MNGSAVPAAVTQEARLTPIPGVGIFALGGRGLFAAFGGGRVAAGRQPGFAKGGTGHPDLRPGFLYPLLRLPLTFRSAALPFGHAANTRGTLGCALNPRFHGDV